MKTGCLETNRYELIKFAVINGLHCAMTKVRIASKVVDILPRAKSHPGVRVRNGFSRRTLDQRVEGRLVATRSHIEQCEGRLRGTRTQLVRNPRPVYRTQFDEPQPSVTVLVRNRIICLPLP